MSFVSNGLFALIQGVHNLYTRVLCKKRLTFFDRQFEPQTFDPYRHYIM
jgi:hypothetical protein